MKTLIVKILPVLIWFLRPSKKLVISWHCSFNSCPAIMKDYTSLRAVLNNEKISTVVHAKDVNRNGGLSFLQLLQFCHDIPRADLLTVTVLSVGIRFGTLPSTSAVLWIRIQVIRIQIGIKYYSWKFFLIVSFDQKLQFTYSFASIKGVQATREAFSPQKRTSSTSKHEIS